MYVIDVRYITFFDFNGAVVSDFYNFPRAVIRVLAKLGRTLFLTSTVSLTLYLCCILFSFSAWLFLWIAACFCCLINCQFSLNVKFIIASRPNTSCIDMVCMVVWTVERIVKMTTDRISFHRSLSSSWDLFTQNVRRILLIVWWACSSMELACRLRAVIGLRVIL